LDESIFGGKSQGLGELDWAQEFDRKACKNGRIFVVGEQDLREIRKKAGYQRGDVAVWISLAGITHSHRNDCIDRHSLSDSRHEILSNRI